MQGTAITSGSDLAGLFRKHALLAALVVCYGGLAVSLSRHYALDISDKTASVVVWSFVVNVPQMIFFILLWRLLYLTHILRVPDRLQVLKTEVGLFVSDGNRLVAGFVCSVLMGLVLMSFAQLKRLIPMIQPFSWDQSFMELDQTLHFGLHPYETLHMLLGGHYILSWFAGLYNAWLLLMYLVLFGACFLKPNSKPRMQYLVAFVLAWAIGGNLMATIFSSAGPPYYALLGLGDAYAPLFARLQDHAANGGLSVIETQKTLWQLLIQPDSLNTISAFPSMHVASSVLIVMFGFRLSIWLGRAFAVFAVCIMLGSVLLGWHYAVDGYAGALVAVLSWKAAGWLIRSPIGPFAPEKG